MKNHEQLPALDENILDGVAGGAGFSADGLKNAASAYGAGAGQGIAKAAVKLPFNLAGAAANFAGDIAGAWEEYLHGIGSALSGGKE
jgi:hypothetical protein